MTDRRPGAREKGRTRGQTLVEFALVFPLFALLLFGVIDVGRLVYVNNAISEGAREGARYGSVAGYVDNCALGRDACVLSEAQGRMAAVPLSTVVVTCERQTGLGNVVIANADQCKANDFLVVRVDTSVGLFTPVIAQILGTITVRGDARVIVHS
jgi:Flp pilus assembly protein TadG